MKRLGAILILVFVWLAGPVSAATPVLDANTRAALATMKPMTGTANPALAGKITVVSFFASWCPPCTDEFRQLNKLRAAYSEKQVAIVALNLFEGFFGKDQAGRMKRFLKRTAPTFPVMNGLDDDKLAALFGEVERIPTVLIFGADGKLVFEFVHEVNATKRHANFAEMKAAIQPLLTGN